MTPVEIKKARLMLGLNQSQMARVLGYGAQTRISEIEMGDRTPSESVVRLIAAYLAGYRPSDWPK